MKFQIIHVCEVGSSSEYKIGSWYRFFDINYDIEKQRENTEYTKYMWTNIIPFFCK
jgi:hypothetical protein